MGAYQSLLVLRRTGGVPVVLGGSVVVEQYQNFNLSFNCIGHIEKPQRDGGLGEGT